MFKNIGKQIKAWSKFNCLLGIIFSFAVAIVIFIIGGNSYPNDGPFFLIGVIVAIIGPINSWVSSWLLYGYGQIIENTDKLAKK